jgi:hypothetical protein
MATTEERLTSIEKKLDLLLANQKQQSVKYENYSAFFRKKLNDSFTALSNAVTSQTVVLSEKLARLEKLLSAKPASQQTPTADPQHAETLRLISELSQAVQASAATQTELMSHHAALLGKALSDGLRQVGAVQDADMKLRQDSAEEISRKVSASFEHLYEMLLDNADLIAESKPAAEKPAAPESAGAAETPETPDIPEEPDITDIGNEPEE